MSQWLIAFIGFVYLIVVIFLWILLKFAKAILRKAQEHKRNEKVSKNV